MGMAVSWGPQEEDIVTLDPKLSQSSMELGGGAQCRWLAAWVTFQWDENIKQEGKKDGS